MHYRIVCTEHLIRSTFTIPWILTEVGLYASAQCSFVSPSILIAPHSPASTEPHIPEYFSFRFSLNISPQKLARVQIERGIYISIYMYVFLCSFSIQSIAYGFSPKHAYSVNWFFCRWLCFTIDGIGEYGMEMPLFISPCRSYVWLVCTLDLRFNENPSRGISLFTLYSIDLLD